MLDRDCWGRAGWTFLHAITMSYAEAPTVCEQEAMRQFFGSVAPILPCPRCREHFSRALAADPPQVGSRRALVAWLVGIHNAVNRRLKKRELTVDEGLAALHAACRGGGRRRTLVPALLVAALVALAVALAVTLAALARRR